MSDLKHQIRKFVDEYNGGFFYQMPCQIINVNTDKILHNNNEVPKPYVKASVKFITRKNEYKTATAICYFKDDENLEVLEDAQENETQMLLESRFDQEANDGAGAMFLKLSPLVFGTQTEISDFDEDGDEVFEKMSVPADDEKTAKAEKKAKKDKKKSKKAKKAGKTATATA